MNTTVPLKRHTLNLINGLATLGLLLSIQSASYASIASGSAGCQPLSVGCQSTDTGCQPLIEKTGAGNISLPGHPDTIHSIMVNKAQSSKRHKVKLYPDARQQVLFFSVGGQDGKVYQLYLYDMDGKLFSQTNIRNKETTVLTSLAEGNYLFEVFSDDERIENGSLTVK